MGCNSKRGFFSLNFGGKPPVSKLSILDVFCQNSHMRTSRTTIALIIAILFHCHLAISEEFKTINTREDVTISFKISTLEICLTFNSSKICLSYFFIISYFSFFKKIITDCNGCLIFRFTLFLAERPYVTTFLTRAISSINFLSILYLSTWGKSQRWMLSGASELKLHTKLL